MVKSGRWQWVFDNVNLHQKIRHERQGKGISYNTCKCTSATADLDETILHHKFHLDQHSVMLNITARLAIKLRYLPNWEIDWSDNNPQASRESLTLEDFLPDEEDSKAFTERAVEYTMHFLVSSQDWLTWQRPSPSSSHYIRL